MCITYERDDARIYHYTQSHTHTPKRTLPHNNKRTRLRAPCVYLQGDTVVVVQWTAERVEGQMFNPLAWPVLLLMLMLLAVVVAVVSSSSRA